jgi:hypothetical protein
MAGIVRSSGTGIALGMHRGVTLLELILALALSVLVLTAVGMSIDLYFKMLDVRRTNVEEAQVLRVVARKMADDIRNMVNPSPTDLSGLETTFQNAMSAAQQQATAVAAQTGVTVIGATNATTGATTIGTTNNTGGNTQAGGQAGGQAGANQAGGGGQGGGAQGGGQGGGAGGGQGTGGGSGGGQSGGASGGASAGGSTGSSTGAGAAASSTSTTTATVVQLVGSLSELRLDVSRLPRVDQYKGLMTNQGQPNPVDLPSDIKTIVYFLRSEASAPALGSNTGSKTAGIPEPSTDGYGRGLMRSEMDRAVSAWAETNGGMVSPYSNAKLLADEITGVWFAYHDGIDWYEEWDSASMGGLPRAIRIHLQLQPTYAMTEQGIAKTHAGKAPPPPLEYKYVVNLPSAPLTPLTPPSEESTDTSGTSSSTSGTTNNSSSGSSSSGAANSASSSQGGT